MRWLKYKPRVGDLIVFEYHKGRRVGIFLKSSFKAPEYDRPMYNIVWTIAWIPIENEKLPSSYMTELTIFHYLKTGSAEIFRRDDGACD